MNVYELIEETHKNIYLLMFIESVTQIPGHIWRFFQSLQTFGYHLVTQIHPVLYFIFNSEINCLFRVQSQ